METQKLQVGRAFPVNIFSDDVDIPFPALSATGSATVSNATQLEDSTANFVQGGINPGDIIYNTSTSEADVVTGVNSPTVITLAGFSAGFTSGDGYEIYAGGNNLGCVLYIGGSGNLEVQTVGGDNVTLYGVTAGQFIPVQVMKVLTGTTATDILALW